MTRQDSRKIENRLLPLAEQYGFTPIDTTQFYGKPDELRQTKERNIASVIAGMEELLEEGPIFGEEVERGPGNLRSYLQQIIERETPPFYRTTLETALRKARPDIFKMGIAVTSGNKRFPMGKTIYHKDEQSLAEFMMKNFTMEAVAYEVMFNNSTKNEG